MEDKHYANSIECVKAIHKSLILVLTLQAFILSFMSRKKTGDGMLSIPLLNLSFEASTALLVCLLLIFIGGLSALNGLFKLGESYSELSSEYKKIVDLYPTFLTVRPRYFRIIIAVLFGLSTMIFTGFVGSYYSLPSIINILFGSIYGLPFLLLTIFVTFWDT